MPKPKSSLSPSVKVHRRERGFTQLDNALLRDKRLSFKARGIAGYGLSHSEEWELRMEDLIKASPQGVEAIRSGLKELATYHYAALIEQRNELGHIVGRQWHLFEVPDLNPIYRKKLREAAQMALFTPDQLATPEHPAQPPISLEQLLELFGEARSTQKLDAIWMQTLSKEGALEEIARHAPIYVKYNPDPAKRSLLRNYLKDETYLERLIDRRPNGKPSGSAGPNTGKKAHIPAVDVNPEKRVID